MAHEVPLRDRHRVVGACIIYRPRLSGRIFVFEYLLLKRHPNHPVYPGEWCVPGGGMERSEYEHLPQSPGGGWDNPLVATTRREVREETDLEVGDFEPLGHFTFIRANDDVPVFGLRFAAQYVSGAVKLVPEDATRHTWVTAKDVGDLKPLGDITDEIRRLDRMLLNRPVIGALAY